MADAVAGTDWTSSELDAIVADYVDMLREEAAGHSYPARHVDPGSLPSAGEILAALSDNRVGGVAYDREWPGRAARTMW
jgi:hypothetical protein